MGKPVELRINVGVSEAVIYERRPLDARGFFVAAGLAATAFLATATFLAGTILAAIVFADLAVTPDSPA